MPREFHRIAIVYGGDSPERQISLVTGKAIHRALRSRYDTVDLLDVTDPSDQRLSPDRYDAAFIALHGGFGEDGTIQQVLEEREVPYTGSGSEASRIAMDKVLSKMNFSRAGVKTPSYLVVRDPSEVPNIKNAAFEPDCRLVVKPSNLGSSVGIHVVDDPKALREAIADVFSLGGECALIEEFIPGRELTVSVLGERTLPIVEIAPASERHAFYDYKAKYTVGESTYFVDPSLAVGVRERIDIAARMAYECVGCRVYARVDVRLNPQNEPYVLEVNTLPGFTPTSLFPKAAKAAGIEFDELCVNLLELSTLVSRGESRVLANSR
ncbi:MAG: D-alanine--D-alanine ligase [Planctomycetes bacterium]|nr:D-alanine--D-alanine ligase [Planctomycetota bacterium]